MPSRWYRSLYWRIALGFMMCLAVMLVVQAVLFIWVASRAGPTMPGQPPERFAETVAGDIAGAVEREPALDVEKFVHEQYGRDSHPVLVMMRGGRVIENGGGAFPEPLLRQARIMLERRPPSDADRADRVERGGRFGRGDRGGLGPGGVFRPMRLAPILVRDQVVGVVVVPQRAPFGFLFNRYAPTLALITGGVLIVGALVAAVVIFGPARRRLRAVEQAARQLGGGDLSARAPARGGDEVAAVATAFNAMADDLAARAAALATSDRARRQVLADVSHELTTPVTAMRGYIETLRMPEFDLDEATRSRYLGIIGDETARLERIIRDLLDLARLEGGGGELVIERVPVAQIFERVTARHERASHEAGVGITSVIEPGAEIITGDRDRLEQALQNLAANAMRYAPPGTVIELRSRVHGETGASGREQTGVTITVTDQGPGITPDHLPHVFDRFYKVESSRAQGAADGVEGGSGLGLSIVKAIVERHGGRISVSSRPGLTVFEFTVKNSERAGP
jgi:two-component system OmpR family sensor kinase